MPDTRLSQAGAKLVGKGRPALKGLWRQRLMR